MDRRLKFVITALLVVVVALGGYAFGYRAGDDSNAEESLGAIERAFDTIQEKSLDPPSPDALTRAAIKAMVGVVAREDQWAAFYDPQAYAALRQSLSGSFSGIGVVLDRNEHRLEVLSVLPSTPAERAGIKPGDILYSVDGQRVSEMTTDEAVARVKGPEGTEVSVTIIREGKNINLDITRQQIDLPNLSSRLESEGIGHIRLFGFSRGAAKDLREEIEGLQDDGMKGLVLDLRDNPGGLFSEALRVASLFIEDGEIVTELGRSSERTYDATGVDAFDELPMVVLVNERTASAAEIVAGALQDRGRSDLVGATTFGKGAVQELIGLPNSAGLKVTTATYVPPDGKPIDGTGIEPDIHVDAGYGVQEKRAVALLEEQIRSNAGS